MESGGTLRQARLPAIYALLDISVQMEFLKVARGLETNNSHTLDRLVAKLVLLVMSVRVNIYLLSFAKKAFTHCLELVSVPSAQLVFLAIPQSFHLINVELVTIQDQAQPTVAFVR